jgi:hypothetical protein
MINEQLMISEEWFRADYFQIWCRNGEKGFFFENSTFEIQIENSMQITVIQKSISIINYINTMIILANFVNFCF